MRPNRFPGRAHVLAAAVILACAGSAGANPQAPSVAAGAATFQTAGKTLTVTNAPGTIINWNSFSIGSGETTRFLQQSASSAVLNRVTGNDPSSLLGTLSSNGRVFLINPHGIVVGAGARIDTAGFIASSLNITDSDFLNNRMKFEGGGFGVVRNEGTIRASGDIMLVGPRVENAGLIKSDNGSVLLAAGQKLTITSPDAQGVKFELQAPSDTALNVGTIEARNAVGMFAGTLRHSGDIRAGVASLDDGGRVILAALGDAIVDKNATITASGTHGGVVQILGGRVALADRAGIDASGERGGGTILVGGDYRGTNPDIPNAQQTYVGADVALKADAIASGDGGKVVVWADGGTRFDGSISARGGSESGNGGMVEVSGKGVLDFHGHVDTRAPNGRVGTLLLDPTDIQIINGQTAPLANYDPATQTFSGSTATAAVSQISVSEAGGLLSILTDTNVTISTASAGPGVGDITFSSPVIFLGAPVTRTLTLIANNDVNFNEPLTVPFGVNLNIVSNTGGATNINAALRYGAGSFDAASAGSGIVNIAGTSGLPDGRAIGGPNTGASFAAKTINSTNDVEMQANVSTTRLNVQSGRFSLVGSLITSVRNVKIASGATVEAGDFSIAPGSTVALSGSGTFNGAGAVGFTNFGTLDLTGNIGSSARISGSYFQAGGAALNVAVADPTAGPALITTGTAFLKGALNVTTVPGFSAPAGSTFNVISAPVVSGNFDLVTSPPRPLFAAGVVGFTNVLLTQLTSAQAPLTTAITDLATNSLLALGNGSVAFFTPQGVQIGHKLPGIGQCQ